MIIIMTTIILMVTTMGPIKSMGTIMGTVVIIMSTPAASDACWLRWR